MQSSTALVLEGGGFRGMYTSGVLDAFLIKKLQFPYVIGVSAGAAYGISYVSQQFERNKIVNLKYTADPRYMSWRNLFTKGNLFDWDFVYGEIPNKLVPFDFEQLFSLASEFVIGITNVQTGKPEYCSSKHLSREQLLQAITASSSLPFVSKMAMFNGKQYMDGGLSDSIPVDEALRSNERAVVVLTRNKTYQKGDAKFKWLIKNRYKKYPMLVETILSRASRYNKTLARIERLEQEGRVFVIRPQSMMNVSRIENDPIKLDQLYQTGLNEALEQFDQLQAWLAQ
ncbi:patatin family protein [Carboxylicivirga sp. M1479]|uniref:patatin-like phospholipase family protein n=1 Tax=Carboxylicivirga sp. M1479 TaxID=2594476 RepID=UPI0011776257|nr:patatin family protein [Carboxylicivirga sp. M1479]TRX66308.1 patatin family protein [Carboxylicivirga sp. M1479]